jgi:hypothetical protein
MPDGAWVVLGAAAERAILASTTSCEAATPPLVAGRAKFRRVDEHQRQPKNLELRPRWPDLTDVKGETANEGFYQLVR